MNHNWRDLSSTILPPSLVFTLALATGILSKTLLIEKPAEGKTYQNTMQMSGVELVHNKFEIEKHTLSIITADSIEYAGKQINFINPNLTSYNGEDDLIELSATNASSNSQMSVVHLNGGAAIKKVDSEGKTRFTIRSKELVFNVQEKIILTDEAVSIEQSQFEIQGQGMVFNQKLGTLEIKDQARLQSRKMIDR
ncbi:LPS export ABC transporter periplasmic protein LptC [Betaproteobacteria bacterium]|nr:LPS export ABC transporter periplasmic protein LptC [Betaproteobacteria bacterium]